MRNNIQNQLGKMIVSKAYSNSQLQKKIASFLGLSYSINNKSVIINSGSNACSSVSIIINGNYSNIQNFNLSQLN